MKEISELHLPDDVRFTKDHEWVRPEGDKIVCGISDYAQDQLGDIVFVELPRVGDTFEQGEEFGVVESVKAVSEIYAPVGLKVVEVNGELENEPEKVNAEPHGGGWICKVEIADAAELDGLMDAAAYQEFIESETS